jgi:hypothetical protein
VTSSTWKSTLDDRITFKNYTVLSESSGCYNLKFNTGEIKELCIVNDNLYVPSGLGGLTFKEVFSRS